MSNPVQVPGTDSERIVYLEPNADFKMAQTVNLFLRESGDQFRYTTASRYDCHCSMTGFFKCRNAQQAAQLLSDCTQYRRQDPIT